MATSLSRQLERLKVPQTLALSDSKRKPSILFDSKEAASKDRRTIYDISATGLNELININHIFTQFKDTLFNEATIQMERAVEHKDINELLNLNIVKFFQHLSPYLMLRPAHMCLEWLIRRFQVQEYNRDDLMALILPYHETNIFVKILQTMRLKQNDKNWFWLEKQKTTGQPLSKTALLNRAASEKWFFRFVCDTTVAAIKELGSNAHLLQSQINFYASIVVGALEHAKEVEEWHITALLPSLTKGLSSNVIDFLAASYIIIARLLARTQVTLKLCTFFINRLVMVKTERLQRSAVSLLIHLFATQTVVNDYQFADDTLLHIIEQRWFLETLTTLAKDNLDIQKLCTRLMQQCVKNIQDKSNNANKYEEFLESFLNEIRFPYDTAYRLISCFLDCYDCEDHEENVRKRINDGDIIDLDDDDEDNNGNINGASKVPFRTWYSGYLNKLERQYPNAFDAVLKEALSKTSVNVTKQRSKAIKMILGYRLKITNDMAGNVYETLYHHSASVRLVAVKSLLRNLNEYQGREDNLRILTQCLSDRLNDDNEDVVKEILKLPTAIILQVLDCKKFVKHLIDILYNIQTKSKRWSDLTVFVIKHLTNNVLIKQYGNNLIILLVLMPVLYPIMHDKSMNYKNAVLEVLRSDLSEKIPYLKNIQINSNNFNIEEFKKNFLNAVKLANTQNDIFDLLASIESTFNDTDSKDKYYFNNAMQLHYCLILATACMKPQYKIEKSCRIFQQIQSYLKVYKVKYLKEQEWSIVNRLRYVPLECFRDFLCALLKCTKFENLQQQHQWELALKSTLAVETEGDTAIEFLFILNILEVITNGAFNESIKHDEQYEWMKVIKHVLDAAFQENAQMKVDFLMNFFVYEQFDNIECKDINYLSLKVKSLKILESLLRNPKNKLQLTLEDILKVCSALTSSRKIIRSIALDTLEEIYKRNLCNQKSIQMFLLLIIERKEEIIMDSEQFPLILYTILKTKIPHKKKRTEVLHENYQNDLILDEIVELTAKDKELKRPYFLSKLLYCLKFINDSENYDIFHKFIAITLGAINTYELDGSIKLLKDPIDSIYTLVIQRFDEKTIEDILMDDCRAWNLIKEIFNKHDVFIKRNNTLKPLPCVFLEIMDDSMYEKMPIHFKIDFIKIVVKTVSEAESVTIFTEVNKLLKKCSIDCEPLVTIIENMQKAFSTTKTPSKNTPKKQVVSVDSCNLKEGIALLELMENKKKLLHTELMVGPLFNIITSCLSIEDQSSVEYCKQLSLTGLLNCLQIAAESGYDIQGSLPKSVIRMDQIVQCLSASPNPQTHRNALLLLSYCARPFPHEVLHNVVHIFTFMGSSVIRQDDAFSFHIINDIITTIVPILVNEKSQIVPVLKVFSDIMLDVPEHRRLPLYTKLLITLDAKKNLWQYLCVVFETHIIHDEKQRLLKMKLNKSANLNQTPSQSKTQLTSQTTEESSAKRINILLQICQHFAPDIILETCIQLMQYLMELPTTDKGHSEKQSERKSSKSLVLDNNETILFDVNFKTPKQLRHYKYVIVQFVTALTNNVDFLHKISQLSDAELLSMKSLYQTFITKILSYIPIANSAYEKFLNTANQKYWQAMLQYLHDILDNAINLLSADMFLIVVTGLMQHQLISVRKKVIELLINKLQKNSEFFLNCHQDNFENLLTCLSNIISRIVVKRKNKIKNKDKDEGAENNTDKTVELPNNQDNVYLQQTALIAVKVLSKLFAINYIEQFQTLLAQLIKIGKHRTEISKVIVATVLLTMIEISSNLKVHSLEYLPKLAPQVIDVLQDQATILQQQPPDNVCLAVVSGVQRLFQALPLFLGPYMNDMLTILCSIEVTIKSQLETNQKDQNSLSIMQQINDIWIKVATDVPLRILVPKCTKMYQHFIEKQQYNEIVIVMNLLQKSIDRNTSGELPDMQIFLVQLFMEALEFRLKVKSVKEKLTEKRVDQIENVIIMACVTWVLKLSESSFRPFYHKVYKWALELTKQKESILTYFRLTAKIADSLKSLFILFAHDFIGDVGHLLNDCHSNKLTDIEYANDTYNEYLSTELLVAIFQTLHQLFLHDNKEFINMQRFDSLMPAIVDQLENRLILENDSMQQQLTQCIGQLAVGVSNDVMWKQLNYQVLLKTRSNVADVRILAFNCCLEIAKKLGEDFSTLLPDTVPFIAELFEDENLRVEKNTRKAVQEMEEIVGESLQKYL